MNPIKLSATQAKLQFGAVLTEVKGGTPIVVEKNGQPEMVCISIDDYEDFLEVRDKKFQEGIDKSKRGKFSSLDSLYEIHKKTITKEAKQ
ncbi:MAG: type II toxin-antitoxin system Phd/YefM family antitoxin [Patescibacteria group bacterium]|nr:type II toxin-antitoxin system Phd/YefM family antitoxin [Patescibacteria group bacterium]